MQSRITVWIERRDTRQECLATKLGIQAFKVYSLGRLFTVQTDHHALTWLNWLKENNSRLSRWSLALQPYDFEVAPESQMEMRTLSRGCKHSKYFL